MKANLAADNMLMTAVRDGDVPQMGVLFERHHRMLFNFFLRMTGSRNLSEDLVQDVFFRMLKYRHTYEAENNFMAWMYQIARNAHLDQTKKRRLEVVPDSSAEERAAQMPTRDPDPQQELEEKEGIHLLRRALAKLPFEKREILILSRFQNLKYDEIAAILDIEVGAVKVRVYRAVRELSEIFFELSGEKAS